MQKLNNVIYLTTFLVGFFGLTLSTPLGAWEVGLESGESNSFLAKPKYFTSSKYSAVTLRHKYVELIRSRHFYNFTFSVQNHGFNAETIAYGFYF